jgi:hypothetical protein
MKDKMYSQPKEMKAPATGSGIMGQAGSVQKIEICVYPDMKRMDIMPNQNRGYDQQAWNYKY